MHNMLKYKVSYILYSACLSTYRPIDLSTYRPIDILSLKGQRVKVIKQDADSKHIIIYCKRDKRRKAIDPLTGIKGTINLKRRRTVQDMPLFGHACFIEIEWAQVAISKNQRRMEGCKFVAKGCRLTRRFCQMISGLCRHLSIQTISRHLSLRRDTVKNVDKAYLHKTLPVLDPS